MNEPNCGGLRLDRLKKLLEHMESGKLSVDRFDFSQFRVRAECGTSGCMAGELPAVFPEEWEHKTRVHWCDPDIDYMVVRLKKAEPVYAGDFPVDAMDFFGLGYAEVLQLFYPASWVRLPSGRLPETATREEVTANLKAFIEEKEKEP
jgi:hypothetical protein